MEIDKVFRSTQGMHDIKYVYWVDERKEEIQKFLSFAFSSFHINSE